VKIRGTCRRDGRDFHVDQVIESGGSCPWDGEPFSADYAVTLVNALREIQVHGSALETALQQVAALAPPFTLDSETVLSDIRASLGRLERNVVSAG
jgi:hypothetical protein